MLRHGRSRAAGIGGRDVAETTECVGEPQAIGAKLSARTLDCPTATRDAAAVSGGADQCSQGGVQPRHLALAAGDRGQRKIDGPSQRLFVIEFL